jgi:hypothetical protein
MGKTRTVAEADLDGRRDSPIAISCHSSPRQPWSRRGALAPFPDPVWLAAIAVARYGLRHGRSAVGKVAR